MGAKWMREIEVVVMLVSLILVFVAVHRRRFLACYSLCLLYYTLSTINKRLRGTFSALKNKIVVIILAHIL